MDRLGRLREARHSRTPTFGANALHGHPAAAVGGATDVVDAIGKPGVKIVDARTPGEIDGTANMGNIRRSGFGPSSIPVYWEDLLDLTQRTFKSADDLRAVYQSHGILPTEDVIAYCLVGMRASVDLFALHLIG